MLRLLAFFGLVIGLFVVINFNNYQKLPVQPGYFDFPAVKAEYERDQAELAAMAAARVAKPHKVEEKVEASGPLVALDTPRLVSGHGLYKKCIVCHGKRGEGKKSQNAPRIGGQLSWYLKKQLNDMKRKVRVNKKMDPYIRKLSTQDFSDLAEYISKLPWKK
ncbi:MAG: c-type cytochrome [Halobacteriovoraceae bacterium]|jgi:cytochrome c553|nr:c-type cytochrome [Halobacteriovoraceae bacterium]MBT5095520.1 c-type cytochrome [Halobacteriovoraceae bacterium]